MKLIKLAVYLGYISSGMSVVKESSRFVMIASTEEVLFSSTLLVSLFVWFLIFTKLDGKVAHEIRNETIRFWCNSGSCYVGGSVRVTVRCSYHLTPHGRMVVRTCYTCCICLVIIFL